MGKRYKIAFREPDIGNDPTDLHARIVERFLIVVAVMLVMAIVVATEARMRPELRVGYFEAVYTSP